MLRNTINIMMLKQNLKLVKLLISGLTDELMYRASKVSPKVILYDSIRKLRLNIIFIVNTVVDSVLNKAIIIVIITLMVIEGISMNAILAVLIIHLILRVMKGKLLNKIIIRNYGYNH